MNLKIVSGGQAGVDRAALAWAIRHGVPHGGWCPCGRKAEDGAIPNRYRLKETPASTLEERTLWNVRDSDGTVILSLRTQLRGGTAQTARFCADLKKPVALFPADVWTPHEAGLLLARFIQRHVIRVLNIAGPRASEEPDAARYVRRALDEAFGPALRANRAAAPRIRQPIPRRSRLVLSA